MESYGKSPMWQKVLMYVVVGGLLYGAVYYFWMKPKGDTYMAPETTNVTPVETAPLNEMNVALSALNDSGQSGTAMLSEVDGKVQVVVTLSGVAVGGPQQPAHIHEGACPGVGAVKYPLTALKDGSSVTMLDVSMDDLKAQLPLAINVHKSQPELKVYTACGPLQ